MKEVVRLRERAKDDEMKRSYASAAYHMSKALKYATIVKHPELEALSEYHSELSKEAEKRRQRQSVVASSHSSYAFANQ